MAPYTLQTVQVAVWDAGSRGGEGGEREGDGEGGETGGGIRGKGERREGNLLAINYYLLPVHIHISHWQIHNT